MKVDKEKINTPAENRFEISSRIFNKWLCIRQKGQNLIPYFEDNLIHTVAIYGMGALGERLFDELKETSIEITYAIDRIADSKKKPGLKIYGNNELDYPQTDVIIVTPVQDYWQIVEQLKDRISMPIVSLEDIADYCMSRGE